MRSTSMRIFALLLVAAAATAAHADGLHRVVTPMTRADGDVCALLRSELKDKCKPIARLGEATVYQSGSKKAGVRRTVLAITTDAGVLVGPAVDVLTDELAATTPTLRPVTLDGKAGFALDLVATYTSTDRSQALVGCARNEAGTWKCAMIDVGTCSATLDTDGNVATACGTKSLLSLR